MTKNTQSASAGSDDSNLDPSESLSQPTPAPLSAVEKLRLKLQLAEQKEALKEGASHPILQNLVSALNVAKTTKANAKRLLDPNVPNSYPSRLSSKLAWISEIKAMAALAEYQTRHGETTVSELETALSNALSALAKDDVSGATRIVESAMQAQDDSDLGDLMRIAFDAHNVRRAATGKPIVSREAWGA